MLEIHTVDNPYFLDYILVDGKKIPALTRKNADFIEAVVRLDSNYGKDLEINPPSKSYDPEKNATSAKGLYCGSTKYWFDQLQVNTEEFKKCVLGTVIAIDRTNSTHIESCVNGRKEMRDRICKECSCYEELKSMLEQPYIVGDFSDKKHLLEILSEGIEQKGKGKNGVRYNLSFASKYCSYAAQFLDADAEYSKYDNVVSKALPIYEKCYLGKTDKKKTEFKISYTQMDENEKLQHRLNLYKQYSDCIESILKVLKEDGIELTRDEFDHIIWYGLKG